MHQFIKQAALESGFDACGIARARALEEDAAFLKRWLAEGKHGSMHYLERNFEKRTDPHIMVPGCKSVVVVLLNYYSEEKQPADAPRIARYAWSETDYHTVMKKKLKLLEERIVNEYGTGVVHPSVQHSFTDSAPVLERRWAQRAGLGWIGKHTQLISNDFGTYCFIGVLMLNVEMEEYDHPVPDRCGSCTRCLDACPTNALDGRSLDARRCISYQTIENRDTVDKEIRPLLSGCALGCDICADVCPWNKKKAKPHRTPDLQPVTAIFQWSFPEWQQLTGDTFNTVFKYSAIKRAGFDKLAENISYVIQNKQDT
jgi:epoxyqueuosine reductase